MRLIYSFIFLFLSSMMTAQVQDTVITDSIDPIEEPKKRRSYNGPLSMFAGNPGKAALYSLILPGAGQFYNKSYIKVPIVIGIEGAVIGLLVRNNRQYKRWDTELNNKLSMNVCNGLSQSELVTLRDRARRQRDITLISTILVHLFQVADAFIHRHLIEFDVSDDLSYRWHAPDTGLGVGLTFTF